MALPELPFNYYILLTRYLNLSGLCSRDHVPLKNWSFSLSRYLNLRGCERISDAGVELVGASCSRMRSLDIGKCDVTDLGLRELARSCPNLRPVLPDSREF
jgi:hypothetical protein